MKKNNNLSGIIVIIIFLIAFILFIPAFYEAKVVIVLVSTLLFILIGIPLMILKSLRRFNNKSDNSKIVYLLLLLSIITNLLFFLGLGLNSLSPGDTSNNPYFNGLTVIYLFLQVSTFATSIINAFRMDNLTKLIPAIIIVFAFTITYISMGTPSPTKLYNYFF